MIPDEPEPEEHELSDIEKLAIAQAFYKSIAEVVSTKDPGNLRGTVDAHFRDLYEQTGAKSFDLKLFGEKVGTYSLTLAKPTPESKRLDFEVSDKAAFMEWVKRSGMFQIDWDAIRANFLDTGEMPEGCNIVEVITPGTPGGEVKNGSIRVNVSDVIDALGDYLPEASRLLLEGE